MQEVEDADLVIAPVRALIVQAPVVSLVGELAVRFLQQSFCGGGAYFAMTALAPPALSKSFLNHLKMLETSAWFLSGRNSLRSLRPSQVR